MSGIFGSSQYLFGDTGFYGYEIEQSCRFDKSGSAYLTKTPSSTTNQKTWTWSGWFKNTGDMTSDFDFFTANGSGAELTAFMVSGDEQHLQLYSNNGTVLKASADLRDTASWYHIMCRCDTTQSTASDRLKFYVNGTETAYQTDNRSSSFAEDFETGINDTVAHYVGCNQVNGNLLNGYLAEVHFTDGVSNAPSAFGETKEGVWIPKAYTGSHGTNGYYLKFDQTGTGTASASTIGADSSGNNNHYTTSGFASIDSNRTDSPTNNFATWNVNWAYSSTYATTGTLVNGALALSSSGSATSAWSTFLLPSSGKYYVEMRTSSTVSSNFVCGVMSTDGNVNRSVLFQTDGSLDLDNAQNQSGLASWVDGNTVGIRLNMDGGSSGFGEIAFYLQNSAYGTAVSISSATSPYALMTYGQTYVDLRTDERDFAYSIPDGYSTLSTANLPEPTISPLDGEQPSNYFNTVLYTGNNSGGGTQNITSLNFKPDWIWLKGRSNTRSHQLIDAVRGKTKKLTANETASEGTNANFITDFLSNGFGIGNDNGVNADSETFVAWSWLGANGTVSNSDGSITSTVSANTTAGFSIVTYTSPNNTSDQTVGHGLGAVPKVIIAKNRISSFNWDIYHVGTGSVENTLTFTTAATRDYDIFTTSNPTSSVFGIKYNYTHYSTNTYVAYCFAEIDGYSNFGSYTGNGDADGAFIYTGFRPAFLIIKRTDATGSWIAVDNKRDTVNVAGKFLYPHDSAAEQDLNSSHTPLDFLSNGMKMRSDNLTGTTSLNISGATYIYMAFAEMPFKYANAR
tara:strand:+ start:63 stop:2447 length:2385 start_codon:yes stop_codon:yes gene_type:complete